VENCLRRLFIIISSLQHASSRIVIALQSKLSHALHSSPLPLVHSNRDWPAGNEAWSHLASPGSHESLPYSEAAISSDMAGHVIGLGGVELDPHDGNDASCHGYDGITTHEKHISRVYPQVQGYFDPDRWPSPILGQGGVIEDAI
jgi:hypothetical protein